MVIVWKKVIIYSVFTIKSRRRFMFIVVFQCLFQTKIHVPSRTVRTVIFIYNRSSAKNYILTRRGICIITLVTAATVVLGSRSGQFLRFTKFPTFHTKYIQSVSIRGDYVAAY